MDSFVKKIFEGKCDEFVHLQFQKFSRGEFRDKAVVKIKNSKGKYSIGTTNEYANELVRIVAEGLGEESADVTGVVVSTSDLSGKLDFEKKKQFMGIKQYVISKEMTGSQIISLCDELPEAFFALSFKNNEGELKIKPKAPKSAKPSTKTDEKPKSDFCKLKTTDKKIVDNFVFDAKDFKEFYADHVYKIEEIILPEGVKDPNEMRRQAKRKGKIIRNITLDGQEFKKEKEFVA